MPVDDTTIDYPGFAQASLHALIRAEVGGRIPHRFTGKGPDIWAAFRNELTITDLVGIAIQDAGVTMPVPFAPERWMSGWRDEELLSLPGEQLENFIQEAVESTDQNPDDYLLQQAILLNIDLPGESSLNSIPAPQAYERWLELPGTAGWVAYSMCQRSETDLYYWENFSIVCSSLQEMLFAGLIAWELDAPPGSTLPIRMDDDGLSATLRSGEVYDNVIGLKSIHGHRDLRILHKSESHPIWIEGK